jgi:ligand-binding sensor domain-containing protein
MKSNCKLNWFLIFVFLLLTIFRLSAQEFSYKHYSIPEGLVQTQVTCLYEDSKGFLWIGTKGGVSRFDGYSFKNITVNDGLLSPYVLQITEDHEGNIWIIHKWGISKYDGTNIRSIKITEKANHLIYLYENSINKLILITGSEKHLFKAFEINDLKLKDITSKIGILNKRNSPYTFTNGISGQFYYHKSEKLFWVFLDNQQLFCFDDNFKLKFEKASNFKFFKTTLNGKLIFINDEGFWMFENGRFKNYLKLNTDIISYASYFAAISPDCFFFQDKDFKLYFYKKGKIIKDYYKFPIYNHLLLSKSGTLWLGSDAMGLFKLATTAFINYIPERSGIPANIWSIGEDKTGNIWFGSYLQRTANWDGSKITHMNSTNLYLKKLTTGFYMGAYTDKNFNIFFTHNCYVVVKYNGISFTRLIDSKYNNCGFKVINDVDKKRLIIGTTQGLIISDYKGNFKQYNDYVGESRIIVSISIDKKGRYWVGSFSGMSIWENGHFTHLPTKDIPIKFGAISQLRDKYDNLWIGNERGLYVYSKGKLLKVANEIFNSYVTDLLAYNKDTMLIGAINGLGMLNLAEFNKTQSMKITLFDSRNGFNGIECGQNGMYKDSKGNVWIPASDRVVCFNPRLLQNNTDSNCIITTNIVVKDGENNRVATYDNNTVSKDIILSYKQNNIQVSYVALNIINPELQHYQYKLSGINDKWSEPSESRELNFDDLKPGEYSLQIRSFDRYDKEFIYAPVFQFEIKPAFWQTWWFLLVVVLASLIIVIYSSFRWFTIRKTQQIQKLEKEKLISNLQSKTLLGQLNPHFVFNAINTIGSVIYKENKEAYKLLQRFSKLIRFSLDSYDQLLHSLESEIEFVSNYLEIEKSRFKNKFDFEIKVDDPDLLKMIIPKLLVQNFAENAVKHGIQPRTDGGKIKINVLHIDTTLYIVIEDNGIGRKVGGQISSGSTGKGLNIIRQTLDFYNRKNDRKIEIEIDDLEDENNVASGTRVNIIIPDNYTFN